MKRGFQEVGLILALYVGYSVSRLFADDAFAPAVERARELVAVERWLLLDFERSVNSWFASYDVVGLVASYWYATLHYVVTAAVLVWLYRRGWHAYQPARQALAIATVLGLMLYLLVPMAPPRMLPDYVDVLQLHSASGWWGGEASAPQGLGGLTNGVPVIARRLGARGRARRTPARDQPGRTRAGVVLRRGHLGRDRRHR